MKSITLFIQVQGRPGVSEIQLPEGFSVGELLKSLQELNVPIDAETLIFVGEASEHLDCHHHEAKCVCRHGARVHVCRCHRVQCTVHYLDKTAKHKFAPGVRIRTVKEWAVRHFHLDANDAAEHVLQVCCSSDRPTTEISLQQLVIGRDCSVCFDLVPETRVEG